MARRRGYPAFSENVEVGTIVFDSVQQDIANLELVLLVFILTGQRAELLGELQATTHVLRTDKVNGRLDTAVEITHLRQDERGQGNDAR